MMKGAIFDVDGTLLDSMGVWNSAGRNFLKKLGIEATPELGDIMFTLTTAESAEYLADNFDVGMSCDEIIEGINAEVEKFYFTQADFKPGARELLDELRKKGVRMAVATSTERYCIEAAFERLGIIDYFDVILSCTDVGKSKEHPDIFFEAIRSTGTKPEETWVFEDGLYSIKTAKKAGFSTVGVFDEISLKDQEEIKNCVDLYLEDLRDFNGEIIK